MHFPVEEIARQFPYGTGAKILAILLAHPRLDLQEIEAEAGCGRDLVEQVLNKLQLAFLVLQVPETKNLSVEERFPRKTFLINPEARDQVHAFLQAANEG